MIEISENPLSELEKRFFSETQISLIYSVFGLYILNYISRSFLHIKDSINGINILYTSLTIFALY